MCSFLKIQNGLTFLLLAHVGCSGKEATKWVFVCLYVCLMPFHIVVCQQAESLWQNFDCFSRLFMAALCNRGQLHFCPVVSFFYLLAGVDDRSRFAGLSG